MTTEKKKLRGFERLDVRKAIGFVEEYGTELENYRLNYLLGKERDDEVPLRYLRGL